MSTTIKKQILIGARALFVSPENWIRGEMRNEANTAWCLEGAVAEAGNRLGFSHPDGMLEQVEDAWQMLGKTLGRRGISNSPLSSVVDYNDSGYTTFNDIQELLDDAIDLCDA